MSGPASYALDMYRGDTFARTFVVWNDDARTDPADLTSAAAKAQIRDAVGGSLIVDLVCAVTLPNSIDVTLPANAWPADGFTQGVWDLQLTRAGQVQTIVAGPVRVSGDVTS